MQFAEKRAWIYNGNRMSPAPLRETTSLSMPNLANNHELRRMQAIDLSASKESGNQGNYSLKHFEFLSHHSVT